MNHCRRTFGAVALSTPPHAAHGGAGTGAWDGGKEGALPRLWKITTSLFSWKERLRPQLENKQQGELGREMHVHVLFSQTRSNLCWLIILKRARAVFILLLISPPSPNLFFFLR